MIPLVHDMWQVGVVVKGGEGEGGSTFLLCFLSPIAKTGVVSSGWGVGWKFHCILHLQVVIEELDGSSRDSPQGALARSTRSKVFVGERGKGKGGRQAGRPGAGCACSPPSSSSYIVKCKAKAKALYILHIQRNNTKKNTKKKKKRTQHLIYLLNIAVCGRQIS